MALQRVTSWFRSLTDIMPLVERFRSCIKVSRSKACFKDFFFLLLGAYTVGARYISVFILVATPNPRSEL